MPEITEDQFRRLKREVEVAKSEADRAQGALEQLMQRLKSEYGCDTLKQAKQKLTELQQELEKAKKEFEKEMAAYERDWKG